MKQSVTLDQLPAVPGVSVIALFEWTIVPSEGHVLLYRTETDPAPQELKGSTGEGSIDILESRAVYYELLSGTRSFQMTITSCRLANI
jgi:hypothetical protein